MGKSEEPTTQTSDVEPNPPAYDENENAQPPPAYLQSESSATTAPDVWEPLRLHCPFPGVLSSFIEDKFLPTASALAKGQGTAKLCIGEDESRPVYTVQINGSYYFSMKPIGARKGMCLRNGPNDHDPIIGATMDASALASEFFSFHSHSHILLSPLRESTSLARERMNAGTSAGMGVTFRFSIEVGTEKVRREEFEWRKVKKGGSQDETGGFELFRVSSAETTTGSSSGGGGSGSGSKLGYSNEGDDVLAVISWPKASWVRKRDFTLKFRSAGLTGELGDRWSLMVVLTALRIWWLRLHGRTTWMGVGIGQKLWGDGDAKQA